MCRRRKAAHIYNQKHIYEPPKAPLAAHKLLEIGSVAMDLIPILEHS